MRYLDTWTRDDAPPVGGFRLRPRSIEMICPNRFERLQLSSFVPDTGIYGFLVEWTVAQSSETRVLKQGGHGEGQDSMLSCRYGIDAPCQG